MVVLYLNVKGFNRFSLNDGYDFNGNTFRQRFKFLPHIKRNSLAVSGKDSMPVSRTTYKRIKHFHRKVVTRLGCILKVKLLVSQRTAVIELLSMGVIKNRESKLGLPVLFKVGS